MSKHHIYKLGAIALATAAGLIVPTVASAAAAPTVTVSIQGKTKTLLPAKTVQTRAGSITRGGVAAGKCPATSAQGALNTATHGNWKGTWYASYHEYFITGILGDTETSKKYYWGLYVNGKAASKGACDVQLKSGDRVLFKVTTRYGGGFVESIDGHSGSASRVDWFYYVNGIEAPKGAGATDVNKGDHIWWDLHDWTAADSVPAVVGSYPEPFTNGTGGKEFPTLIDCAPGTQSACDMIGSALRHAGVKAADQGFGTGSGSDSLAVVVGTWRQIQGVVAAELIAGGPKSSGVYAQFVGRAGRAIELDNPNGDVVQTLYGNAGLIAATEEVSLGQPTWFVTGTDAAGVSAAARAFSVASLHDHFAVAISGHKVIPIPVVRGS